jgi:ABC-type glycerol-3-phosphate transport system permease component
MAFARESPCGSSASHANAPIPARSTPAAVDCCAAVAAATFTIVPAVVLYFVAQRYFVEAAAGSGIKG